MIKRLKGAVLLVAAVAGAGALTYNLLLTDEARASLRRGVAAVRDAVETLNETLGESENIDVESLPNRRRTMEEWDALGIN